MAFWKIKPKEREWITKDGSSIEEAKSWTSATNGTTLEVPYSYEEESSGHYWAVKLSASTEYTLSSQYGGEMGTLKLLAADGSTLAEQTMDYEEWVTVPATYTPSADMVAYIYFSSYDSDTLTFSPRPADYETEHWADWEDADGFTDDQPLASPARFKEYGLAGDMQEGLVFQYTSKNLKNADTGQELTIVGGGNSLGQEADGRRYTNIIWENEGITVPDFEKLLPTGHPFTIIMTFCGVPSASYNVELLKWGSNPIHRLRYNTSYHLEMDMNTEATATSGGVNLTQGDTAWHTVAATFDGRSVLTMLDGAVVEHAYLNSTPAASESPLYIAQSEDYHDGYTGKIGSIFIYDRAMPGIADWWIAKVKELLRSWRRMWNIRMPDSPPDSPKPATQVEKTAYIYSVSFAAHTADICYNSYYGAPGSYVLKWGTLNIYSPQSVNGTAVASRALGSCYNIFNDFKSNYDSKVRFESDESYLVVPKNYFRALADSYGNGSYTWMWPLGWQDMEEDQDNPGYLKILPCGVRQYVSDHYWSGFGWIETIKTQNEYSGSGFLFGRPCQCAMAYYSGTFYGYHDVDGETQVYSSTTSLSRPLAFDYGMMAARDSYDPNHGVGRVKVAYDKANRQFVLYVGASNADVEIGRGEIANDFSGIAFAINTQRTVTTSTYNVNGNDVMRLGFVLSSFRIDFVEQYDADTSNRNAFSNDATPVF